MLSQASDSLNRPCTTFTLPITPAQTATFRKLSPVEFPAPSVIAIIACAKSMRKFQAEGQRKSDTDAKIQSANMIVSKDGEPFEPWSRKFVKEGIDAVVETLKIVVDGGTNVCRKNKE